VETKDQKVEFKSGDMVFFPKGLSCQWTVLKPVKKYYRFD
ncbi:MAG TPA: cupin domain-containing protein, partial [bacterium]|nr:cupin domain-containing protein [bacterium]